MSCIQSQKKDVYYSSFLRKYDLLYEKRGKQVFFFFIHLFELDAVWILVLQKEVYALQTSHNGIVGFPHTHSTHSDT